MIGSLADQQKSEQKGAETTHLNWEQKFVEWVQYCNIVIDILDRAYPLRGYPRDASIWLLPWRKGHPTTYFPGLQLLVDWVR